MDDIEVYDSVPAHTLDDGDRIVVINPEGAEDYLEDIRVIQDTDAVMVKGYSHVTGDNEVYILDWEKEIDLWRV